MAVSPPRPPPRPPAPPKASPLSRLSPASHKNPSPVGSTHNNDTQEGTKSPQHHTSPKRSMDYLPSTPLRSPSKDRRFELSPRLESSPLKAAASLIQSLDIAHTEMKTYAANAATDAENARRNARTAQEIARRYSSTTRSTFQLEDFGGSPKTTSFLIQASPRVKLTDAMTNGFHTTINGTPQSTNNTHQDEKMDCEPLQIPKRTSPRIPKTPVPPPSPKNSSVSATKTPTSYERIARHHADDVLQLTRELERTRQQLKSEQRAHKDCLSSLKSLKKKTIVLESTNQQLMKDIEREKADSTEKVNELNRQLEESSMRLQAAEDDAQLALDLAKDSAEQKEELEDCLQTTREELERLQKQSQELAVVETPKKHVHFAGDEKEEEKPQTLFHTPREGGPSRAMIAAGRQILLRRSMSPQDAVIKLELTPSKSAERRQLLSQRLKESILSVTKEDTSEDASINRLSSSPTPPSPARGEGATKSLVATNATVQQRLEEYQNALKTLQISGKRLDLDGYCWRDHHNSTNSAKSLLLPPNHQHSVQIDVIARQYCQNVEFKIGRQQKDIEQLESLCEYLEKKLVLDGEDHTMDALAN